MREYATKETCTKRLFLCLQMQTVNTSYGVQMANESRRMSEPCQSTKPIHSPQPPRPQSAAPQPQHNPSMAPTLVENLDADNLDNKLCMPDDIMSIINLVSSGVEVEEGFRLGAHLLYG